MTDLMASNAVRSFLWRLGRRIYCSARRDRANNPATNGEYWLLNQTLALTREQAPMLIDIGANRGDWSERAVMAANRRDLPIRIHAFEPAAGTFAYLSARFSATSAVHAHHLALSCKNGTADFYIAGELAGTSSLGEINSAVKEKVTTITLDYFFQRENISHAMFVKSDTEGHDLSVMRGANAALSKGSVEIWQFEYNHRWVPEKSTLREVFEIVRDKPYRVGKLFGDGIEIYEDWHPELERYFEANYVLIRRGSPLESLCTRVRFDESNVLVADGMQA